MKARRGRKLSPIVFVLVFAAACTDSNPAEVTTTATPTTATSTTQAASTTTTVSPTTTTATTAATPAPPTIVAGSLPLSSEVLIYGEDGIVAITSSAGLIRLSDTPTAAAFAVGDVIVVSQRAAHSDSYVLPEGPILVDRPGDQRAYAGLEGEELTLFDADVVDGKPVAVIGASTGGSPDDKNQQLLLLDLETFERTDLGSVGWWEAGIDKARLAGNVVVLLRHVSVDHELEARSFDGKVLWSFDTGHPDGAETMVATDTQVLLLHPRFEGDDFRPFLDFERFDLNTGEPVSSHSIEVDAEFGGGFCGQADWNGWQLLCSESYGGPFSLDIQLGTVTPISSLEDGAPSVSLDADLVQLQASQSEADAVRDGIVPELAALPIQLRSVERDVHTGQTRIEADEGVWLVSVPHSDVFELSDGCAIGDTAGLYGRDVICVGEYAEVLLLDKASGAIIKAYPFPGVPPRAIAITDDAVYCNVQGDGALPDSMLCRIDRTTLKATVRIFPFLAGQHESDPDRYVPNYWTINESLEITPFHELVITDEGIRITGYEATALVDPQTLELYDIEIGE